MRVVREVVCAELAQRALFDERYAGDPACRRFQTILVIKDRQYIANLFNLCRAGIARVPPSIVRATGCDDQACRIAGAEYRRTERR
jgi:hypothetical protein